MSNARTIDYRFKILYAVAISMIVAGHVGGGGITLFNYWFPYYGIHLAIFAFCSGYFYKSSSEDQPKKFVIKKVKHLLVPLYIYNLAYGIIVTILHQLGVTIGEPVTLYNILVDPVKSGHAFLFNLGGWYIIPLFMLEMSFLFGRKALNKIHKFPEWALFAISIVLGVIGNRISYLGINYGWWLVLDRMLYFFPFFGAGIFYKKSLEKLDSKIPSFWYFACIISIRLIMTYRHGGIPLLTPAWCQDFPSNPVLPLVIGYTGIAFWLRISRILEPVIGRSKWINLIADNTFSIMMNQFAGFFIVGGIYAFLNQEFGMCTGFDFASWKTNIWYIYAPNNVDQTLIIYEVAGLFIPIIIQMVINYVKKSFETKFRKTS